LTTHRRYSFLYPDQMLEGHEVVLQILQVACEQFWWYQDPHVEGLPFGRLGFSFTVSARDRWWAHRRALKLAQDCTYAIGLLDKDVPYPDWESLAPHTNRGLQRVPAASSQD
jgi:hypothetical protein